MTAKYIVTTRHLIDDEVAQQLKVEMAKNLDVDPSDVIIVNGVEKVITVEVNGSCMSDGWTFPEDLIEAAWGLIANASDWDNPERAEWRQAAERWRDAYHDTLTAEVIDE